MPYYYFLSVLAMQDRIFQKECSLLWVVVWPLFDSNFSKNLRRRFAVCSQNLLLTDLFKKDLVYRNLVWFDNNFSKIYIAVSFSRRLFSKQFLKVMLTNPLIHRLFTLRTSREPYHVRERGRER